MAFVLPTFNLSVNLWRPPATYAADPPTDTFNAQLRAPDQTAATVNPTSSLRAQPQLLCAPGTDIRDTFCAPGGSFDTVEVPAGSGRYYSVVCVDDIAKGFTNEHRYALLTKQAYWPAPIP